MPAEDHPLEYEDFEGVIPDGEYGAGRELSVDEAISRGHVSVDLHGKKLRGDPVKTGPEPVKSGKTAEQLGPGQ